jgi:hypothetical protein
MIAENSNYACPSAGGTGLWDNATVESLLSSLKHDSLLKASHPTREHMKMM